MALVTAKQMDDNDKIPKALPVLLVIMAARNIQR